MAWLETRFEGWPRRGELAEGRDLVTGARVHLKVARTPAATAALERELVVADRVRHRALRDVLDEGWVRGARAAAFEWVQGDALDASHLARLEASAIEVLRALLALHTAGYVHGDSKPEHLRVGAHGVHVIDLGLAVPLGAAPAGGTRPYLAPEYERGAVASVAGDLYALGVVLRPLATPGSALAAWAERACSLDPAARPASAEVSLGLLGARPRASDRSAARTAVSAAWLETVARAPGTVVRIDAPTGSGATTHAEALARHLRDSACALVVAPAHAATAIALAQRCPDRVEVVVDGPLDRAVPSAGVRVLVLAPDPSAPIAVPSIDRERASALATSLGAAVASSDVERVVAACEGRAGRVAQVLARLAEHERLTVDDALELELEASAAADAADPITRAEAALERRAPRAAMVSLERTWPALGRGGPRAARMLWARAAAEAGALAEAADVLEALEVEGALPERELLVLARSLERLGRTDALVALRTRTGLDAEGRAELASMVAAALFTRGQLAQARALAEQAARAEGVPLRTAVRLACIASDAALRAGDATAALSLAEAARARAVEVGEPRPLAQATARVAGVHAMAGRWSEARAGYLAALGAAEQADDCSALSPYLMNLAAAEHALFEVEPAIAHYERAIALARELERAPSEAAACTNLGALLELVGAHVEAEPLLARAEAVASAAGAAVAVAQARMIHAEVVRASGDRSRAVELARAAHDAFVGLGVERQATECALLLAELALDAGDDASARDFVERRATEAIAAGLGARLAAADARARLARGDVAGAARTIESALATADVARDREATLRLTIALAAAHARLGTGAAPSLEVRARALRGSLALQVPAGLRERFLARHPLPELAPERATRAGLDATARSIASLLRRTLRTSDEGLVLEAAVDEAIALTQAERAFLLARRPGRPVVSVARNLDRETIKNSRFRFSRSVAERVLSTGEPLVTASASDDPELAGARSILDLGVRSILCVPIRGRGSEVLHALYLDHRFERARFSDTDLSIVEALADVIGLCLENARLHAAAEARERELVAAQEGLRADAEARAIEIERLSRSLASQQTPTETDEIVGRSRALRQAIELTRRVAPSAISVLIEGESGTGKELFARLVHRQSPRHAGPMLSVNCGALPETLLESELFGHVRGAFTGALRDQPGLFRAADGGTLFLDEIGEMPLSMQARLLRVLSDGEVRPVGATRGVKVDVRIVTATNRDLSAEVKRGAFREDLFFRIAGVRVALPPLRERREDLPLLCAAILSALGEARPLAPDALRALAVHPLPGNVRELEQALRRAAVVADDDVLHAADLGLSAGPRAVRGREPTRAELEAALAEHGGNRSHAARALGLHRTTLHRLLHKHGVRGDARRGRPRVTR